MEGWVKKNRKGLGVVRFTSRCLPVAGYKGIVKYYTVPTCIYSRGTLETDGGRKGIRVESEPDLV